jgi:hypothetical protein
MKRKNQPNADRPRLRVGPALTVALALMLVAGDALPFGWKAHALIAERAQHELKPAAAATVKQLLSAIDARSMSEVAAWADQHRNRTTARWHYINLPPGTCHYVAKRDCPDGNCLVEAIRTQQRILADTSRSPRARGHALRYLIHLVGDAYQPLHAGRYADRGGNRYQVNIDGRGSNLHRLWDTGLARYRPNLRHEVLLAPTQSLVPSPPRAWVERSCQIVNRNGFYPSHKPTPAYLEWAAGLYARQIERAGDRLALVLNRTLKRASPHE